MTRRAALKLAELPQRVTLASAAERAAHERLQELLQQESGGRCLWQAKAT
jgi:hypothetical protein